VPPRESKSSQDKDEHAGGFGVSYANELALEALTAQPIRKLPPGSIIVREKLRKADDVQPLMLAAMIKRLPGFNPKGGDWEFVVTNGAMSNIIKRTKGGECRNCHSTRKDRDFVFAKPSP